MLKLTCVPTDRVFRGIFARHSGTSAGSHHSDRTLLLGT